MRWRHRRVRFVFVVWKGRDGVEISNPLVGEGSISLVDGCHGFGVRRRMSSSAGRFRRARVAAAVRLLDQSVTSACGERFHSKNLLEISLQ